MSVCRLNLNRDTGLCLGERTLGSIALDYVSLGCNISCGKLTLECRESVISLCVIGVNRNLCVKRLTDHLLGTRHFKRLHNVIAVLEELIPLCHKCCGFVCECLAVTRHIVEEYRLKLVVSCVRHCFPDLLCCKGDNGGQESCDNGENVVKRALAASSLLAVSLFNVKTILCDINVKLGKLYCAELVDGVVNNVELVLVIRLHAKLNKLVCFCNDPLVDLKHIVKRDHIGIGIEIAEVSHHDTRGVSDLSVRLGELLEDVLGATDVSVIIAGCRPKTNKLCAVLLNGVVGAYRVAKRLVHRSTLSVNNPTVGKNCLEGSLCLAC